ncbi:MAG: thioredoxin domain-containing protein [Candidatus Omnitrophica bacterium]|nr:thioredoxin domain-containing protein [Candidatus Omnitrophota bacterium]
MQKSIFTLVLVVIIGILLGVAVVKKQAREPLLREILVGQQILLQNQMKMEKRLDREGLAEGGGFRVVQNLQELETRITTLESQIKGLQEVVNQVKDNAGSARQLPPAEDLTKVYEIPVAHSPIRGEKKAPVTIVEFVDFQCPFCARFHPPIAEVLKAYPKEVNYILKNFPLSFHAQAKPAAKAAFAAGEQGKYWEMADALLENNTSLSEEKFQELAKDLGLDVKKFTDAYKNDDAKWEKYIQDDFGLGQQVNVRGTPTFYMNGRKTQARDFNGFKKEIDQILSEKK